MAQHRQWRKELGSLWRTWDKLIERARREGALTLPCLPFPQPAYDNGRARQNPWIESPARWACMSRGLGDYARFALMRYLASPGKPFDPGTVRPLAVERWLQYVNEEISADDEKITDDNYRLFDSQVPRLVKAGNPGTKNRISQLKPLFEVESLWRVLADATNEYFAARKQGNHFALSPDILRNRRFSGRTAVLDFIRYRNTGIVPARQPPFPDELGDLGVASRMSSVERQ